jgi:hypothetical protein
MTGVLRPENSRKRHAVYPKTERPGKADSPEAMQLGYIFGFRPLRVISRPSSTRKYSND